MPSTGPLPVRYGIAGTVWMGAIGALLGLVLGLGYPLTAWFAALEIGIPASIVGGLAGFVVGLIATAGGWIKKGLLRLRSSGT